MKNRLHILTIIIAVVLTISISFNIVLAVNDGSPEPGSDQDPLVSKSYVDSLISKYESQLQTLKEEINRLKTENTGAEAKGFETVSIKANQKVLTGKGAEIILKSGKATVFRGKNGALTDINLAKDLANGTQLAFNHLIISSQNDGRGFKTSASSWVLIKGSYTVENISGEVTSPANNTNSGSSGKDNSTTTKAKVTASSLNIRAETNTTSKIVGKLVQNEEVTIISKSGEWYKIKNSKGITGWVMGKYIKQ